MLERRVHPSTDGPNGGVPIFSANPFPAWPFCPRSFWVAFWHPVCYRMRCEAIEVRRGVYLLLTVFLVQLSGLRALCVPSQRQTHACCPIPTKTTPPSSSSVPDCCLTSILNYQGSITETRKSVGQSELTAQSATVSVPSVLPLVAINTSVRQRVLPSISPPRSPLAQSCLLLI
jgi:hypothetical protein